MRQANKNIIHLDGTYLHNIHTASTCWQSENEISPTNSIGKGLRLIIIHAGRKEGFVPNTLQMWQSKKITNKKQSDDYNDDIDFCYHNK